MEHIFSSYQKSILGNDKTVMTNSPDWRQGLPKKVLLRPRRRGRSLFEAGGETALMNRRDLRQKRETTSFVPVSKCFQQTKCWLIVLQFLNDIEQPQSLMHHSVNNWGFPNDLTFACMDAYFIHVIENYFCTFRESLHQDYFCPFVEFWHFSSSMRISDVDDWW